ncbi:hypothetical protein B0I08_10261 [Glaciihabitans tibetensis]|uniref:DUF5671 domain-containing protein n=1 Tax=Glaciihabitans tibetensis TaxID=1266600 RepID=A0A2T0VGR0_9MICO|nr:DUF5671 domain-containing protein [Glaciihabitans tibetensis]PRY69389.1 hypothetical protein B0I08_10261 [Glaciihabitans tibetensis]
MIAERPSAVTAAQPTVRRLIVYTILFALVMIAAIGLSGLVGRLLDTGVVLVEGDVAGLAQSLAFTLIAGPLAAVLWWFVWRRLSGGADRSSVLWGVYITAVYTVSLITFTQALLGAVTASIGGDAAPRDVGTGLVWWGVWIWHRWMLLHPVKGPRQLRHAPGVVGFVWGLAIGVAGSITGLGLVFREAIDTVAGSAGSVVAVGNPWWEAVLQSLVWAVGGWVVWWWHWNHDRARALGSDFATVAVIAAGIAGGSILTLGGLGVSLFVVLRLTFDRSDPLREILDPLSSALATATVGAVVWAYHRTVVDSLAATPRLAASLVTSGVGLVATASGVGVIVNALLAALTPALVGADARTLLLAGISSAVVGGPLWWIVWKPASIAGPAEAASPARRVYLIAVFGLSAVVAVVTLLVVGYRVFEFALDGALAASLLDRVRAPLGLLFATVLVAAYHFVVWRRELVAVTTAGLVQARRIGRIILVSGANAAAEAQILHAISGAPVTIWSRASDDEQPSPDAAHLADALGLLAGKRVLVVVGPGSRVEAIGLAD